MLHLPRRQLPATFAAVAAAVGALADGSAEQYDLLAAPSSPLVIALLSGAAPQSRIVSLPSHDAVDSCTEELRRRKDSLLAGGHALTSPDAVPRRRPRCCPWCWGRRVNLRRALPPLPPLSLKPSLVVFFLHRQGGRGWRSAGSFWTRCGPRRCSAATCCPCSSSLPKRETMLGPGRVRVAGSPPPPHSLLWVSACVQAHAPPPFPTPTPHTHTHTHPPTHTHSDFSPPPPKRGRLWRAPALGGLGGLRSCLLSYFVPSLGVRTATFVVVFLLCVSSGWSCRHPSRGVCVWHQRRQLRPGW
jgi:hypothetical protein